MFSVQPIMGAEIELVVLENMAHAFLFREYGGPKTMRVAQFLGEPSSGRGGTNEPTQREDANVAWSIAKAGQPMKTPGAGSDDMSVLTCRSMARIARW